MNKMLLIFSVSILFSSISISHEQSGNEAIKPTGLACHLEFKENGGFLGFGTCKKGDLLHWHYPDGTKTFHAIRTCDLHTIQHVKEVRHNKLPSFQTVCIFSGKYKKNRE